MQRHRSEQHDLTLITKSIKAEHIPSPNGLSAEHLDMPTDTTLRPTNQNQSVNDPPTNQPDEIAVHCRPFIPKYEYLRFYY